MLPETFLDTSNRSDSIVVSMTLDANYVKIDNDFYIQLERLKAIRDSLLSP